MNFIFSILFFIVASVASFFISRNFTGEAQVAFFVAGCILGIISFVFSAAGFFQNLEMREMQKYLISRIKKEKRDIELRKQYLATYKTEVESFLTKLYPDYEKEMFKTMSPRDAETLQVFASRYPELKFNGVLQSFTEKLAEILRGIRDAEVNLEHTYEQIRTRDGSGWFLARIPIPEDAK